MVEHTRTYIGPTRFHYVRSDEDDPGTVYHEIMRRVGCFFSILSIPLTVCACCILTMVLVANKNVAATCGFGAIIASLAVSPVLYITVVHKRPNEKRIKRVKFLTYGTMIAMAAAAVTFAVWKKDRAGNLFIVAVATLWLLPGWLWGLFLHRHTEDSVRAWLPAYFLPHAPAGTWDRDGTWPPRPQFASVNSGPQFTIVNGRPQFA